MTRSPTAANDEAADPAVVRYPGGKNGAGVYQTIINQMPPHRVYVEPFLGGGAVMRRKRRANVNMGLDLDPVVAELWRGVPGVDFHLACGLTWLENLPGWVPDDALVYADPPYLKATRRSKRDLYRFELPEAGHRRLLSAVERLRCRVILSGYPSALYDDALPSWRRLEFATVVRGGAKATEVLWMNFPPPAALHDYRYLGADYRERERVKKKVRRWVGRLEAQPELEAQALMSALQQLHEQRHK